MGRINHKNIKRATKQNPKGEEKTAIEVEGRQMKTLVRKVAGVSQAANMLSEGEGAWFRNHERVLRESDEHRPPSVEQEEAELPERNRRLAKWLLRKKIEIVKDKD